MTIGRFVTVDFHGREHPEINAAPRHAWADEGWLPPAALMVDLGLLLLSMAKVPDVPMS
ncbi:MAG: hypothetical protein ABI563_05605 [Specibacter sp.]